MGIFFSLHNKDGNSDDSHSTHQEYKKLEHIPKDGPLIDMLDYIASHYILSADFQSLRQLHEKEYCEKMVVLTADIINRYFDNIEINAISNRIDHGHKKAAEKISLFKKSDIENITVPDFSKKQMACNKIAKFYIKIAHIFAAIVTTINPEYMYTDIYGNVIKSSLFDKNKIPEDANVHVSKLNLCSNRINALNGQNAGKDKSSTEKNVDLEVEKDSSIEFERSTERGNDGSGKNSSKTHSNDEKITVHPEICSVNLNTQDNSNEIKNLEQEPGIPELLELYYDDEYDYKTGKFKGMSESNKVQFMKDLKRFHEEFTGITDLPENIKKFSDIKLRDYNKTPICTGKLKKSFEGTYKDELFAQYAQNLKHMTQSVNTNQHKLLEIVNKLFKFNKESKSKRETEEPIEVIKINSELTEDMLDTITVEVRNIIIELYLKCEADFIKGVQLYEAIVEAQIFITAQGQINSLKLAAEQLYNPNVETSKKSVVTIDNTIIQPEISSLL